MDKEKKGIVFRVARIVLLIAVFLILFIQIDRVMFKSNKKKGISSTTETSFTEESLNDTKEDEMVPKIEDMSDKVKLPFSPISESIIMYDIDNDDIIYTKNPTIKRAPASLTKIMTFIVAYENTPNLSKKITFKQSMLDELMGYGLDIEDIATIDLVDGEELTMEEALNILLIRSSNDVANLVATDVGGNIETFVEMMNKKAKEIGANDTYYKNAHGLDMEGFETTAYDIYLITKYAMQKPIFMDITSTEVYHMNPTNKHEARDIETYVYGQNKRYSDLDYYYPYLKGIKTGYTDDAGRCLVSSADKDGKKFLLVVMGFPKEDAQGNSYGVFPFYLEVKHFYEWAYGN